MAAMKNALFLLMLSGGLAGCEPQAGAPIETLVYEGSAIELTVRLLDEGSRFNPAQGNHIEVECRRKASAGGKEPGTRIGRAYFVEGLKSIPRDRITMGRGDVFWGTLFNDFFVSFGGCGEVVLFTGHESILDPVLTKSERESDKSRISLFSAADVCEGGRIVLTLDPHFGKRGSWVVSDDRARSWALVHARPECRQGLQRS